MHFSAKVRTFLPPVEIRFASPQTVELSATHAGRFPAQRRLGSYSLYAAGRFGSVVGMHPAAFWGCLVASLVCLGFSLRLRRRHRLLRDLPTSKAEGVFIGEVEVQGTAESDEPLVSFLAAAPCVLYRWTVHEHWSRLVMETTTDSKGRTRTRMRRKSGWKEVASGGDSQRFYVRDDTGVVQVDPTDATVHHDTVFSQSVGRLDPLYFAKGPADEISDSTGTRRFTEEAVRVGAEVFVLGTAREREDIVAPVIAKADGRELIVSCKSEDKLARGLALGSWSLFLLGLLLLPGVALVIAHDAPVEARPPLHALAQWSAIGYLMGWALAWVWMVHNSILDLRERVRQGWSLIEVQLKRRHDLIPRLEAVVSGLAAQERDVQTSLAALRSQAQATKPGVPGPDPAALVPTLRMLAEAYPELTANPAFGQLSRELISTEQRIALARSYYNSIATHYLTRLQTIPDRWVAALRRLQPEPLLAAAEFERAPVEVKLR